MLHTLAFQRHAFSIADVMILENRVNYTDKERTVKFRAPFGNCIALFGADEDMVQRLLDEFQGVLIRKNAERGRGEPLGSPRLSG